MTLLLITFRAVSQVTACAVCAPAVIAAEPSGAPPIATRHWVAPSTMKSTA